MYPVLRNFKFHNYIKNYRDNKFILYIEISPYILKKTIIIAKPIADSAAATVKINRENTCPKTSSMKTEK